MHNISRSEWTSIFEINRCRSCFPKVEIVSESGLTVAPQGIAFDDDYNLIIKTKKGIDFTGFVSISFDKSNGCAALNGEPIKIPLNVHVCGNERLVVKSAREVKLSFEIGKTKDQTIKYDHALVYFKSSNPLCPIVDLALTSDLKGNAISQNAKRSIEFNDNTKSLKILNNAPRSIDYHFYIQA